MSVKPNTEQEFTQFVRSSSPRLQRTALLLTGDPGLAEDILQTADAKLFVSWRRVRSTESPLAFARTTLTNVYLSHRRARRNSELPSDALPDAGVTPSRTEDRLDLMAALRTLPPIDRAILVLRYWEDRTVVETAAVVGLSEVAVRSRATRALARIRVHLTSADLPAKEETR